MKTNLIKRPDGNFEVLAQTDRGNKLLDRMQPGEILDIEAKRVRDYLNHKRFFAMLNIVFENQKHFQSLDPMRRWLIMKTGRFIKYTAPNGHVCYEHKRMNYASMDEDEFIKLKEDVADVALKELVSGLTQDELWRQVEEDVIKLGYYHAPGDMETKIVETFDGEEV